MTDTATLRDLLARVKACSGPDRELDRCILLGLFGPAKTGDGWTVMIKRRGEPRQFVILPGKKEGSKATVNSVAYLEGRHLTGSADDALDLVDRLDLGPYIVLEAAMQQIEADGYHSSFVGALARAIIAAALEALLATASPVPAQAGGEEPDDTSREPEAISWP